MSQLSNNTSTVSFDITATAGKARSGILSAGTATIETPNLFPVVNFYGGGRSGSMFGGSTHRTIKELMVGADRVDSVDCSEYFDAAMMTVSSLTEYGISRNVLRDYLSEPIKARSVFDKFNGMLFIDSGGFQILQRGGLDGSDFQIDMDQDAVFEIQRKMGGDILVNLDRPISPDDNYDDRVEKARLTGQDALKFADLAEDYPGARYLTFQGYDYSMINTFVKTMQSEFGNKTIQNMFDGIALGGLVPKKDDRSTLIDAVLGCKEVMAENGVENFPLHVLGISSGAIPLLAALGVDTFDSSSYLQNAINGKYATSLSTYIPLDDVDFDQCDCPVCSSKELVSRMNGDAKYRKDIMGPVAVHNYLVQHRAVKQVRELIQQGETAPLIDYIDATVGREDSTRKHAHRVVNESLGGYF